MADAAAIEHSQAVVRHLAEAIAAAGGWISFEDYMDRVLYAPGLGYYSAGAAKFGVAGDFVTAPEISRLFGAALAAPVARVLEQVGGGAVLEIGAGSGRLARDLLSALALRRRMPERYYILDVSADLRARQRETLRVLPPDLSARVIWVDTPPQDFDGVIVANEVLDALPVARFRWHGGRVQELGVGEREHRFEWQARPAGARFAGQVAEIALGREWHDGYISEWCPRLTPWVTGVTCGLRRGAVLWSDYGLPRAHYYHAERHQGTLICHLRHRAHDDPFAFPGIQDITAWVDFTALALASRAAGFELCGFTTQAHFLADAGIDLEMQRLAAGDELAFARLAGEARRLMLPGEMGERFKLMAWTRGIDAALPGFGLGDLRYSL